MFIEFVAYSSSVKARRTTGAERTMLNKAAKKRENNAKRAISIIEAGLGRTGKESARLEVKGVVLQKKVAKATTSSHA